jgi:hypothetical protein
MRTCVSFLTLLALVSCTRSPVKAENEAWAALIQTTTASLSDPGHRGWRGICAKELEAMEALRKGPAVEEALAALGPEAIEEETERATRAALANDPKFSEATGKVSECRARYYASSAGSLAAWKAACPRCAPQAECDRLLQTLRGKLSLEQLQQLATTPACK